MSSNYFSKNGQVLPAEQAVVALDDIAYAYGFGVYETIRLHNGIPYFAAQHWERLVHSAAAIGLEHRYDVPFLTASLAKLVAANEATEANVKILLIGGRTAADATLTMQLLNPLYPDRKLYRDGAHCITTHMERAYPQAKTLNMLPSYLAYREAQAAGAYDALLVDKAGTIREGTRTNFFVIRGQTIISPPEPDILPGVMRQAVLRVAHDRGFTIIEQPVPSTSLANYDGAFLTSTSSKIMPIHSIDHHAFSQNNDVIGQLLLTFNGFYTACNGTLTKMPPRETDYFKLVLKRA